MKDYSPIFATSMARSGAYLISMMLSANKDVMIASDPYLEVFRSMRNAFVRYGASPDLQQAFDPQSSIQDYYYTDERIGLMDVVQAGDLATPFDPQEWDRFLETSISRAGLQCAELAPYLPELKAESYKGLFDNALDIMVRARSAFGRKWVGFKDSWTIEFFGPLARAYPDARFIIIFRDPRAIINSMLGMIDKDPSQLAHALSYARHWRKYVAFLVRYRNDPLFSNRLYFLTHEQVLREPERKAREMCDFLEVDYASVMLDTVNYFDFATGAIWKGNSSFEDVTTGISIHRAERWRDRLDPRVLKMVEFMCGPDMKIMGYEPVTGADTGKWPDPDILDYIIDAECEYAKWRSDLGDPQQDFGFEMFRRALLTLPKLVLDAGLVRRSFLFEEVFSQLRQEEVEAKV